MPDDADAPKKVWTPESIAADPDAYFDAHVEDFKAKSPGQPVEAIREQWKYASHLFGYEPLK